MRLRLAQAVYLRDAVSARRLAQSRRTVTGLRCWSGEAWLRRSSLRIAVVCSRLSWLIFRSDKSGLDTCSLLLIGMGDGILVKALGVIDCSDTQ